jgi:hypothetical protein
VAGCCECCDEPSGSCTTELVLLDVTVSSSDRLGRLTNCNGYRKKVVVV